MKVLVCGGRDFQERRMVFRAMDLLHSLYRVTMLISGKAKGADQLGIDWAHGAGVLVKEYPAEWATHGNAAGPIRNRVMLHVGDPDYVVVFPGGRGTADMRRISEAAGKPIWEPYPEYKIW